MYPFALRALDNFTKFELTPEMQNELKDLLEKVRPSPPLAPHTAATSLSPVARSIAPLTPRDSLGAAPTTLTAPAWCRKSAASSARTRSCSRA